MNFQTLLLIAPPILLALTFHEYAHAYAAYRRICSGWTHLALCRFFPGALRRDISSIFKTKRCRARLPSEADLTGDLAGTVACPIRTSSIPMSRRFPP
jgi:hypothetical protein